MPSKLQAAIAIRWNVVKRIYFRPISRLLTVGMAGLSLGNLLISEYASTAVQQRYRLVILPLWTYPAAGVALLFLAGLEGMAKELGKAGKQAQELEAQFQSRLDDARREERERFRDDVQLKKLEFQKQKEHERNRPELVADITWVSGSTHEIKVKINSCRPLARIVFDFPAYEDIIFMGFMEELHGEGTPLLPFRWHKLRSTVVVSPETVKKPDGVFTATAKCVDTLGSEWQGVHVTVLYALGDEDKRKKLQAKRVQEMLDGISSRMLYDDPGDSHSGIS